MGRQIGAKIFCAVPLHLPDDLNAGIILLQIDADIGEMLVIPQEDIIIGLVLFDEAFNNMDDERIGGVLEFLRRLPLQLIIAAPPDKIQYIRPGYG